MGRRISPSRVAAALEHEGAAPAPTLVVRRAVLRVVRPSVGDRVGPCRPAIRRVFGSSTHSTTGPSTASTNRRNASSSRSMSPQYQRWSSSMFVTIAASSARRRNVPSLSSASTIEPLPRVEPGVRADLVQLAADEEARMHAGRAHDQRDHRGGRGLAVRAGDAETTARVDDAGQQRLRVTAPGCPRPRRRRTSTLVRGTAELDRRSRRRRRERSRDLRHEALDAKQP